MKTLNNIVISQNEPSKDCLWIKDNTIFYFSLMGWTKLCNYEEAIDILYNTINQNKKKIEELSNQIETLNNKIDSLTNKEE